MKFKLPTQKIYPILESYNRLIAYAIFLLVIVAGGLLILMPRYYQAKSKIDGMKQNKAAIINQKTERLETLNRILSEYRLLANFDKNKINKIIPEETSHADIFPQIQYLGLRNGLLVKGISYEEADAAENLPVNDPVLASKLGIIKISVSMSGVTYNGLIKLLGDLESNIRLMDVASLGYDPNTRSLGMDIYTYYWK